MAEYDEGEVKKLLKALAKLTEEEKVLILDFDKRFEAIYGLKKHVARMSTLLRNFQLHWQPTTGIRHLLFSIMKPISFSQPQGLLHENCE